MVDDVLPGRDSAVERAWRVAARPEFIGLLLLIAGATCVVVATSVGGGSDAVGWLEPLRVDYAIPTTAGLLGGALVLWGGVAWARWSNSELDAETGGTDWRNRRLPMFGALAALAGGVLTLVGWFALQSGKPPGQLTLSSGEKTAAFEGRVAGEAVDVMFPYRVHLERAKLEERPTCALGLAKPGKEPFSRATLGPGESMAVGAYRVTPVGLSVEKGDLRATFSSHRDRTVRAVASPGESFQLRPDGPEYQVETIQKNYLDSLGPAAKLSNDELGTFMAFQRMPEGEAAPKFLHDVRVDGVEKGPAVVFSVTPKLPTWPVAAGGALLVFGFALCLAFAERVRIVEGGDLRADSLNEAGRLFAERSDAGEET